MPALAVKEKTASRKKTSFDAIRIIEVARLVADLPQESEAANDELASDQNVYTYVHNSPTNYTDPTGTTAFNNNLTNFATLNTSYFGTSTSSTSGLGYISSGSQSLASTSTSSSSWLGTAADIGVGFTPAGVAADVYGAASGKTFFGGQELSGWERALGLIPGVSEGIGVFRGGVKTVNAVNDATTTVRHYTDSMGVTGITRSGSLDAGTFVTLPSQIPTRAGHLQIENLLEIAPGRGGNYIDIAVPQSNLKIPFNGPTTSGGALQFQLKESVPIGPTGFKRPPGRPGGG